MRKLYAVQVTPENINDIVIYAERYKLNLKDHLQDSMEFNAEDGEETMIVMHADDRSGPLYFDDMTMTEFNSRYTFTNGFTRTFSVSGSFKEIKTKSP